MQLFGISGHLRVVITNEDTGKIREYEYHNIAKNAFLEKLAQWIAGANSTGQNAVLAPSQFKMGTGTGTVNTVDGNLFAPVNASLITVARRSASGNQVTITINYPPNYVLGTFTEGGLLDSNDILLTHVLLSPSIEIVANESVAFTYTITVVAQ